VTTIRYQDVLEAVRRWALAQDGAFSVWQSRRALYQDIPGSTLGNGHLSSPYCAIVLRALNALAADGTLVKEGKGRSASYSTPAAQQLLQEARARTRAKADAERERWAAVRADLAQFGLADIAGGRDIRLVLEDWERLAGRLKDG
jgi:hypothetical protein